MKHYLVTGGAGFIGSHLANLLIDKGHKVRVLDNLSFGNADKLPDSAELIVGDITDDKICIEACKGIDGVFHLAAFSRSGPSFTRSEECHRSNVTGTLKMLNAAVECGVKRFVYSGSSTFYGNRVGPQDEELPGDFLNFYGLTKHIGELYVQQYFKNFGLECNILRYFNVYGPGQSREGEYALVIGIFLDKLIRDQKLEIHGSGEQRRDFIHVTDVVEANVKAMLSDSVSQIYNIGSGENYSINEIADQFPLERYHTERRAGDAEETLAVIDKAKSELNWEPAISLEEGLQGMIKQALAEKTSKSEK